MAQCWDNDPEARPSFVQIEKRLAAYFYSIAWLASSKRERERERGKTKKRRGRQAVLTSLLHIHTLAHMCTSYISKTIYCNQRSLTDFFFCTIVQWTKKKEERKKVIYVTLTGGLHINYFSVFLWRSPLSWLKRRVGVVHSLTHCLSLLRGCLCTSGCAPWDSCLFQMQSALRYQDCTYWREDACPVPLPCFLYGEVLHTHTSVTVSSIQMVWGIWVVEESCSTAIYQRHSRCPGSGHQALCISQWTLQSQSECNMSCPVPQGTVCCSLCSWATEDRSGNRKQNITKEEEGKQ